MNTTKLYTVVIWVAISLVSVVKPLDYNRLINIAIHSVSPLLATAQSGKNNQGMYLIMQLTILTPN